MRLIEQPFCAVCASHIGSVLTFASTLDPAACFVAGAVYGDRHHRDVVALQGWRDRHLSSGARGRSAMGLLVALYGRVGPRLATVARRHPRLSRVLRRWLIAPAAAVARRATAGQ